MTYEHKTTQPGVAAQITDLEALKAEETARAEHKERKRLEAIWWAGALIWAGLVFAADSLGLLPQIGESDAWSWVFFGAGLYGMLGNLYRVANPNSPNPKAWDYIWSGGLLIAGLAGMSPVDVFWPVILVLVGVVILAETILQRR
ncbi:MAG: hypothetical protein JSV68_08090 [Anaerolineaceae bacterium]|nr:MAG: hypothetical protein JSV68_08090 [Anaerolineaceae bacterium]